MTHSTLERFKLSLRIGIALGAAVLFYFGFTQGPAVAWYLADSGEAGPPIVAVTPVQPAVVVEPQGVDVSDVRVGQRYHFDGLHPEVWEITEVTPTEIRYQLSDLVRGTARKRPGVFVFPRRAGAQDARLERLRAEVVTVGDVSFECQVYMSEGIESWSSGRFPGTLKSVHGETVLRALVKIERL